MDAAIDDAFPVRIILRHPRETSKPGLAFQAFASLLVIYATISALGHYRLMVKFDYYPIQPRSSKGHHDVPSKGNGACNTAACDIKIFKQVGPHKWKWYSMKPS